MRLHNFGGGVLHTDFDVDGLHKDYAHGGYLYMCELGSNRCQREMCNIYLNCPDLGSSCQFLNELRVGTTLCTSFNADLAGKPKLFIAGNL